MNKTGSRTCEHSHEHERGIVMSKATGRFLLMAGLIILTALFSWEVFGADLNVIEVRRNIPLSDEAPVYKDFYINAGTEAGLKKNLIVNVTRKISVRDATGTQNFGEIEIPVGQLRVVASQGRVAIARLHKLISRDEEPMLEQTAIMIGDKIEMSGSFIDNKRTSAKKSE